MLTWEVLQTPEDKKAAHDGGDGGNLSKGEINIVVLNGWEICTTSDEVLETLGEGHTLTGSYSQAGPGQQAEPLRSCDCHHQRPSP